LVCKSLILSIKTVDSRMLPHILKAQRTNNTFGFAYPQAKNKKPKELFFSNSRL